MALHDQLEKQGYNLRTSANGLPFFVLVLSYIFILTSAVYPENYFFQASEYEIIYESACLLFSLSGYGILIYTNGYTNNASMLKNTSVIEVSFSKSGAYSVVRHPISSGIFLMWLGPCFVTGNLFFIISFMLFCCVFFERIMFWEELQFKKKLGVKYSIWAEQVPALIPNLHKFKKPDEKFNIARAFKNSTGQLSLVLFAFFLFDAMTEILGVKPDYNDLYFIMLLIATLITTIYKIEDRFNKSS